MKKGAIVIDNIKIPVISLDVAVIGSGCAGFNAADWLYTFGRKDIAIITEGVNMGTSRNTGSDKQTYYKLSLSGGEDSVAQMAADLFSGIGVNGDTALAEAAGSVRSFIKLCNLGVPFPTNEYGEYVGYKTDHDPRQRATSAGPLTSKMMTECLERAVRQKGIPILDGMTAIKLIVNNGEMEGLICLDRSALNSESLGITVVRAKRVIMATGGPAGCYFNSVYPESQTGMSGMALEAGAKGCNLQEWQYGLASLKFRWNVSGTYQQVIPRYISIDKNGVEREFLLDYFNEPCKALDMVFLKGYQWPFDADKIYGSSIIDILVHYEAAVLGRRVFLDFRRNPTGMENGFGGLGEESYQYLSKSGALFGTPIQRLEKMNRPAIELYLEHGIDLYNEPLEIGVCAQHHNGGIAVDANWQSDIKGLYVAGEAAGTFGVRRPGGSALNSTQVGSLRAAEHIACTTKPDTDIAPVFCSMAEKEVSVMLQQLRSCINPEKPSNVEGMRKKIQLEMSRFAGHLRDINEMKRMSGELKQLLKDFFSVSTVSCSYELPYLMKNRDLIITQLAVLSAIIKTAEEIGSRGSSLVLSEDGVSISELLPFRYKPCNDLQENCLVITDKCQNGFISRFKPVRPLPEPDNWFENVWNKFRERNKSIYGVDFL